MRKKWEIQMLKRIIEKNYKWDRFPLLNYRINDARRYF